MLPVRVTRDEQRITLPLPIIVCPLPDRFWADLSGVGGRVKGEPVRTGGEPIYPRPAWADGEIQRRVIMNATYGTRRFACANTSNAFGCIPINLSGMQTRHGMKLLVIGDHRSNRWTEREREREEPTPSPDRIIRRRGGGWWIRGENVLEILRIYERYVRLYLSICD